MAVCSEPQHWLAPAELLLSTLKLVLGYEENINEKAMKQSCFRSPEVPEIKDGVKRLLPLSPFLITADSITNSPAAQIWALSLF